MNQVFPQHLLGFPALRGELGRAGAQRWRCLCHPGLCIARPWSGDNPFAVRLRLSRAHGRRSSPGRWRSVDGSIVTACDRRWRRWREASFIGTNCRSASGCGPADGCRVGRSSASRGALDVADLRVAELHQRAEEQAAVLGQSQTDGSKSVFDAPPWTSTDSGQRRSRVTVPSTTCRRGPASGSGCARVFTSPNGGRYPSRRRF